MVRPDVFGENVCAYSLSGVANGAKIHAATNKTQGFVNRPPSVSLTIDGIVTVSDPHNMLKELFFGDDTATGDTIKLGVHISIDPATLRDAEALTAGLSSARVHYTQKVDFYRGALITKYAMRKSLKVLSGPLMGKEINEFSTY